MVLRIRSDMPPCSGDSAIRFTTIPLMRWTSSRLPKKPEAISDSYCSRPHAIDSVPPVESASHPRGWTCDSLRPSVFFFFVRPVMVRGSAWFADTFID